MTRQLRTRLSLALAALIALAGCHPTQPFYFHEDGDLSHYLDMATQLEQPDVYEPQLAEVQHAMAPLTISDPEYREIWELSLEEAVSIALHNSKVIRNLGGVTQFGFADALVGRTANSATVYDAAIVESDAQNGVEAALAAFDAQLSILGSNNGNLFSQTDRPNQFDERAESIIQTDRGGVRTELSKRSASGTQFSIRNQTDYTRGATLFGTRQPVPSIWETLFEIEVRQPLLRGRGTQINRIPIMLARINTDVTLASFEASVRNLVLDIENTYWDLHLAYRALETAKVARDSAQMTWNTAYVKMKGQIETAQAEAQAREQYFFFRSQLESALNELYNVENRLRFLMGLAATDGRLIRPSEEPTGARVEFDWRQIHAEALARSAELRQQKWTIQRRELELIAARNQLLPQLDVGATYRWYGIGDRLINADRNGIDFANPMAEYDHDNDPLTPPIRVPIRPFPDSRGPEGSTAFDVLTDGHYQEAALFLSFQMPVGYRREMAGVRNAQLSLAREKARLEDMELNTSNLLSTAVRSLDFNYRSAQTHFNRWAASEDEVQSVQALYEGGKVILDLVLEAQRRRAQAQIDYYRALAEYNKSLAEVHFRKGSLLEHNNIQLAEGPWPAKAYWDALGHARQRDASYYMDYGWTRPRVISQGPVQQQVGDAFQTTEGPGEEEIWEGEPGEVIPTPAPTPAKPPADEPEPKEPGPITSRPEGPRLNAPRLRADAGDAKDRFAAGAPADAFQWGNLGLGIPRQDAANPLRQVSHEEAGHASPVTVGEK